MASALIDRGGLEYAGLHNRNRKRRRDVPVTLWIKTDVPQAFAIGERVTCTRVGNRVGTLQHSVHTVVDHLWIDEQWMYVLDDGYAAHELQLAKYIRPVVSIMRPLPRSIMLPQPPVMVEVIEIINPAEALRWAWTDLGSCAGFNGNNERTLLTASFQDAARRGYVPEHFYRTTKKPLFTQ